MADKTLSYFMREDLKKEEIFDIKGPATIKDENGETVVLKIKRLSNQRITEIYDAYKTQTIAMDKKTKKPYVVDGKVVVEEKKDYGKAMRRIVVESLVYPNCRDKELMAYYGCVDVTDMPLKMFTPREYQEVVDKVNKVLGIGTDDEEDEDLEAAKN